MATPSREEMLEDLDTHEGAYSRRRRELEQRAATFRDIGAELVRVGEVLQRLAGPAPADLTDHLPMPQRLREDLADYEQAVSDLAEQRAFLHQAGRRVD